MQTLLRFLYFLSLIFWLGSIFFFSFIAARSAFKILPREMAGDLVADIFPKYYLVAYVCGGVALLTTMINWVSGYTTSGVVYTLRIAILFIMLGLSVYAGTIITPNAHELRIEMRTLPKDVPRYIEVQRNFSFLHKRSAIINSLIFLLGVAIVVLTAYNYKD
ncbi:MAG: DUF4149 domain-containing protein [Thermodesulfobacteriota bacterium]